jgi:thioredoxin reductase (NADPH)
MTTTTTEAPATTTRPPEANPPELPPRANPRLTAEDCAALRAVGAVCHQYQDGEYVYRAGDVDVDLVVVESGRLDMLNPADGDRCIATHGPGEFTGDIDLLTRRPVIVSGRAHGPTGVYRVPGSKLREVLNRVPALSEKLLVAFQERRRLLQEAGVVGMKVVGPGACRDTTVMREFLYKNFVPFTYYDSESPEGKAAIAAWGSPKKSPIIHLGGATGNDGDGNLMINPSLRDLAQRAGIWRECPVEPVDLAIVGGGPAGLAAAVYAASEGVSTVVMDRLGPGGQAAGSSRIENFIGFPSGLSGMEFATRGVLQLLKFGAKIAAPVEIDRLESPPAGRVTDFSHDEYHVLHLDCGAKIQSKVVLVATGVSWRKLEADGAARYERAGVYYACTAVEALLHEGDDVVVVGGGNSAGQAAMYLAECCRSRRVHLLVRSALGPSMSDYLVGRIRSTSNITVHEGVEISKVNGGRRVEEIELKRSGRAAAGGDGGRADSPTRLRAGAIFVFIGAMPSAPWLPDTVARDHLGYILTGADALATGRWPLKHREPCPLETTLPGVLAAGDVRAGSTKRVGFAVGDGSLSVTCVHKLTAIRAGRSV